MTLRRYLRITLLGLGVTFVLSLIAAAQLTLATPMVPGQEGYTFEHALVMQLPLLLSLAFLFPLVQALVQRFPFDRDTLWRDVAVHVGALLVVSLLHLAALVYFMHLIGHGYPQGHTFWPHFQIALRFRWMMHLLSYLSLLGVALVIAYYRRYRERSLHAARLEAQLSRARLHALRMQLNPHFLFNALNSIAMLTRRNENARAVRMIAGLGDLLRYVLEDAPVEEVTLRGELRFIERYLEIERVRFGERLGIAIDVQDSVLDAFVPNLLLQPLVENAVKHGVARKAAGGTVTITGARVADRIVLEVTDDGPGLPQGPHSGSGVGLINTRERLEQLYGEQASLDVVNAENGGVRATIWLPFRNAPRQSATELVS